MKRFFIIIAISICAILLFLSQHFKTYIYLSPQTDTSPCGKISPAVNSVEKALNYAKKYAKSEGKIFDYLFFNIYGSGFIKNNPIPNDLDCAVGIYLGEYEYDGKNADEIARSILDKMNTFRTAFNFYVTTESGNNLFISNSPFEEANDLYANYSTQLNNIKNSLDLCLNNKSYVTHTIRDFKDEINTNSIAVPYIMKQQEILIENRRSIKTYSDLIKYNNTMPQYMRECSIGVEYFLDIIKNGEKYPVELVLETNAGIRLQLSRRFFCPQVFTGRNAYSFLNNLKLKNDDKEYIYHRLLAYRRHLQEMNNILVMEDKPVKLFKRLMQTADMIEPFIDPEVYEEIQNYASENLSDENIKLLNEFQNITNNLIYFFNHPNLFMRLNKCGKIQVMHKELKNVYTQLEKINSVDKDDLKIMKTFVYEDLKGMSDITNDKDFTEFMKKLVENDKVLNTKICTNNAIWKQIKDIQKVPKYIDVFNKIYLDSGYHKVSLYWIDKNTIGIEKDDFTKNIKDFKKFAEENDIINVNYVLLDSDKVPNFSMRYDTFARYNPTKEEDKKYQEFINKLLNDRNNYNLKFKFVFY